MKKSFLVLFIFVLLLTQMGLMMKTPPAIIGHNDPDCSDGACDALALQEAIDNAPEGATVYIEGIFDFGEDQFVSIKKDLTLSGKKNHTTIKGGLNALAVGWDPALGFAEYDEYCYLVSNPNTQRWPAEVTIENIRFEAATWSAIHVGASEGVTIRNNEFIDGLQFDSGCGAYFLGYNDGASYAIQVSTSYDARNPVLGEPSDITGSILIEENYFEGRVRLDPNGFDPVHGALTMLRGEPVLMNGMLSPINIESTNASITITKNVFEDIQWGLFLMDNTGAHVIAKNTLNMNPTYADGRPMGFVWSPVSIQNYFDSYYAPITIEKNSIFTRVEAIAQGFLIISGDAEISNNEMVFEQSADSLWPIYTDSSAIVLWETTNSIVSENKIEGTMQFGISLTGDFEYPDTLLSELNVVEKNHFDQFAFAPATDIWCRLFYPPDCPVYEGSHIYFTSLTRDNYLNDQIFQGDLLIFDDTSDFNPFDPATYNGDNHIAH